MSDTNYDKLRKGAIKIEEIGNCVVITMVFDDHSDAHIVAGQIIQQANVDGSIRIITRGVPVVEN